MIRAEVWTDTELGAATPPPPIDRTATTNVLTLIDQTQENVTGTVRLKLYKGAAMIVGRKSPVSLYSLEHVTFEEDAVYDQMDAAGFIKLNALRLALHRRQQSR